MKRRNLLVGAAALAMASPLAMAGTIHVTFINPGRSDEPFWRSVTRVMLPAAQQLGITLEVLYAQRDHTRMLDLARQVARRGRKPDYLIVVNEKQTGAAMLGLAEAARIKTLLAFSTLEGEQAVEFGVPRARYRHWLGSITPNAADAGRLTARELLRQALRQKVLGRDGKVHMALIGGDKVTPTGTQRLRGALAAVSDQRSVVLEQVVHANWDRARAREQMQALLLRYPRLDAVWVASDLMAYGAMEAAEAAGRTPGKDLLFSAVNNSPEVLRARVQGRISALAGGHFTAGAFGLVMLHDYHHGKDFAQHALEIEAPLFALLDVDLAQRFLERFGDEDFSSLDFRRFSRHLDPRKAKYAFGLLPLLE